MPRLGQNHSHLIPVEDYARLERAVADALRETVGADEARVLEEQLLSRAPSPFLMPRSQALLLALREALPLVADPCCPEAGNCTAPRWTEAVTTRPYSDRCSASDGDAAARADSASPDSVTILDTIDVPIVVVGPDCTLNRINRAAAEAFALAPIDIGRRLGAIAALAGVKDIEQLCAQVISDDAASRHDIRSGDRRFLLRIAPYAIGPGPTAGAVLTFTNVTAFRASIEQAIYEREYTKAILNTITSPLVSWTPTFACNRATGRSIRCSASRERRRKASLSGVLGTTIGRRRASGRH